MTKGAAILTGLLVASTPVLAQLSDASPVNIEADANTVDMNQKVVTYSGNVIVSQGDLRLRANAARAEMGEGSTINRVIADGGLVINAPSGTITGDVGTYDVGRRLITVTGRVVLTRDRNVLRGAVLTYNLDTRDAKFSAPGRRVQGLFVSPARSNP